MSKWIVTTCAFLSSVAAFAATPNFSVLNYDGQDPGQGPGKCIQAAWASTNPTDDQNNQAKSFMDAAHAVFQQHGDSLKQDFQALKTAWAAYPIVKADVVTAETALQNDLPAVKEAMEDATINTLNLLSADQRKTFDAAAKDCFHGAPGPGPGSR
jgi:Spy/CpxP family protein refolding chaperone